MSRDVSFKNYAIVACGTLKPELEYLKTTGFLDAGAIFYTAPGLHQVCDCQYKSDPHDSVKLIHP